MENHNSIILEELSKLREEFEKFKIKFNEQVDFEQRLASKKNHERPFGMLNLPSKGLFYKDKNDFLLIGYLTYFEESILTNEMMHEANIAMSLLLDRIIIDNNFDIKKILSCDVQAISMFLRAYSYGNNIEVDIDCPHCGKKDKHTIMISDFKSKDMSISPDENGELPIFNEKFNRSLKIKPRSYFEEIDFKKSERKQVELMGFYITEFDGERDKSKILNMLSRLKIMESRDIKKSVFDNLPGIDTNITYDCVFCDKESSINFGSNGADFLKLPASFMSNVLEEIFLLAHYSKGISEEGAKKMPVGERRWMINRLSEEITKKNDAEKAAVSKAKSKGKR